MFTETNLFKRLRKELIAFSTKKELIEIIQEQDEEITIKLKSSAYLYDKLGDAYSKENLIKVVMIFLFRNFELSTPLSRKKITDELKVINAMVIEDDLSRNFNDNTKVVPMGGKFGKYPFIVDGKNVDLYTEGASKFLFENDDSMHYKNGTTDIGITTGDIVIGGGSCFGESDFKILSQTGSTGKVFGVEVEKDTRKILDANIKAVSKIMDISNYKIIDKALWNEDDCELEFTVFKNTPQLNSLLDDVHLDNLKIKKNIHSEVVKVQTIKIDTICQQQQLNRLDFIKLDVEGAELNVLQGAKEALIRYKPKLGISIYHLPNDYETIPRYLESLNVGYQFYLKTFYHAGIDTILFCISE